MRNEFWLVWNEGGSTPTFKHVDVDSAAREAKRLCRANGGTYHVLRCIGRVIHEDIHEEWASGEGPIPF